MRAWRWLWLWLFAVVVPLLVTRPEVHVLCQKTQTRNDVQ